VSEPRAITADSRPIVAAKARLRWDARTSRHLLLYPERGLILNPTAADVIQLCTGEHTVGAIVDRLAAKYAPQPRETVEREVLAFLARLADRGLISDHHD
jgi:coenzyme PQQ biosynthesis protein PqqD